MKKIVVVMFLFASIGASAQEEDIFDMSLEDLLNMEVTVASKTGLTTREAPGVITVITQKEIQNAGSRDLIDVLRMVPGITFASDVEGIVGIGMRGNWGNEGKILFMIDGQEQNEINYGSLQFGNRYDVSQIERIEIIRGPGSSIYGGFAELGVINVITKNGGKLNGVEISGTLGMYSDTYARQNVSIAVGKEINDFQFSVAGMFGKGQRSNADFTDIYGDASSMINNSDLNPTMFNVGVSYKGLSARIVYDNYTTTTIAYFDELSPEPIKVLFPSTTAEVKYDLELNDKLTLTPKFNYVHQTPWKTEGNTDPSINFDLDVSKITGGLHANYDPNETINLVAGVEYFVENGKNNISDQSPYFSNGEDKVDYNTAAFYAQGLFKTNFVNITVGGRVINHNQFGTAFAPRIGLTKVMDKFHVKALYGNAFRAPNIANIDLNATIKPERTEVAELELGYQLTPNMIVTANVFDITIKDPIVYSYDEVTLEESYENFAQSGSRGIELEYRINSGWGYASMNYTFASTAGKNQVAYYEVPTDGNAVVGMPKHKVNFNSHFNITKNFGINPSIIWLSDQYAYKTVDVNFTSVLGTEESSLLFNLYLNYNNLFVEGLTVGAGVYDLFDQKLQFVQPYDGYLAPLPGPSREIVIKASYKLPF